MLAFIATLTLFHSISATAVECPDNSPNWFVSGDSCYLVSLEPFSWYSGQEVKYFHNICHFHRLEISLVLLGDGRIPRRADHDGGGHSLGELSAPGFVLLDWTERYCQRGNLEVDGESPGCQLHQLVARRGTWRNWQQLCFQILASLISGLGWSPMYIYRMGCTGSISCTVWNVICSNNLNKSQNILYSWQF